MPGCVPAKAGTRSSERHLAAGACGPGWPTSSVPRATLADVLAEIRQHPALFREVYPDRTVNSLYLDSPARRDYFQHVNGVANRVKTRLRWYGPLTGPVERPTLERKFKRGVKPFATLTPKPGGFVALMILGRAEVSMVDPAQLGEHMRATFEGARQFPDGRWLFHPIESERDLDDTALMLALKLPPTIRARLAGSRGS